MKGWKKTRIPLQFAEGFQLQGKSPVQEDYFEINPERGIFILADGFGGGPGRMAAEVVVKSVRQFLEQEAGDLDATLPFEIRPYFSLAGNVLFNAIAFANQKLNEKNRGKSWMKAGGASLIAGYLEGNLLAVAQVGACRLWLKRGDKTKEIIQAKSLLAQTNPLDAEGQGDEIPLMSLGTSSSLEPLITEVELRGGDQLLFETSGVKSVLRDSLFRLNHPQSLSQLIDSHPVLSNSSAIWAGF